MNMQCSIKLFFLGLSALVVNCGGGSGVGNQADGPPLAKAEVFGATQSIAGEVEVRSGKDVQLSGSNSDGVDDPILSFSWEQVDDSGIEVDLYERSSNSVVFTAPSVPLENTDGVDLEFELTVVDADGVSNKDRVVVRVKPAYDTNRFLLNPRVDERFVMIVAAPAGSTLDSEVPFSLNMTTEARWQDRSGNAHSLDLKNQTFSGVVGAGLQPALTDTQNTYFKVPVPLLNADEINVNFKGERRGSRLEFEKVEDAYLSISTTLTSMTSGSISLYLAREAESGFILLDNAAVTQTENQMEFSDEWLRQQLLVESRRTANNYYDCIDPLRRARTLNDWIENAGFAAYPETVIHTSYVNNYDLNFGRDMFVRQDENGNVYTYVTNYPNLENIFSGRNEFAIVVMEYSAAPTGNCGDATFEDDVTGKKIVKFYSYVPDEVTGEAVLAPTMNFDGRGERMVPGVCVACHYGDTNSDQFNAENLSDIDARFADLNSSFMPWDMDAFLYTRSSDVGAQDPVYNSGSTVSEAVTENFRREAQEPLMRMQNQVVLDTFTHDIQNLKRFETPIKMLHGWYGNSDAVDDLDFGSEENPLTEEQLTTLKAQVAILPDNPFNGEYVQKGWRDQEALYHQVFARNCRLCHAQVANPAIDFDSYEEFINNERLRSYVFEQGIMPLSRLTMDRFWIDFYNEKPAAEILRDHLNNDADPSNDVAPGTVPGYPVARVSPVANITLPADVSVEFGERVLFDASDSLFADSYEWSVDGVFASEGEKFELIAGNPGEQTEVSVEAINTEAGLFSRTLTRSVAVNNNTPVANGVPNPTVNEGQTVELNIFDALCPGSAPDQPECRLVFGDIETGDSPQIALGTTSVNGDASIVDAALGLVSFSSNAPSADGDGEFTFTLTDSFGETSAPGTVSVTVNSLQGPEISADSCVVAAFSNPTNLSKSPNLFDGSDCENPAANDTAAEGLNLQLVSVGTPDREGSSVTLSANTISYTPGRFFLGTDSFLYTVEDDSPSQRTARGTVEVVVEATQTFASLSSSGGVLVKDDLDNNLGCGGCHNGTTFPDIPVWSNYAAFRAAVGSDDTDYGTQEISLSEPTSRSDLLASVIFRNACLADAHSGGNRLCNTNGLPNDISDLNADGRAILRWIEEGGFNNN